MGDLGASLFAEKGALIISASPLLVLWSAERWIQEEMKCVVAKESIIRDTVVL